MTTDLVPATPAPAPAAASAGAPRSGVARRFLRDPLATGALVVLLLVVLVSVFAPLLAPYSPDHVIPDIARAAPGGGHLMGGDGGGRDVFSRLLYGGRLTLLGALVTILVALVVGVPAGLLAGYYGRAYDAVFGWATNTLMAIPGMVLLLSATAAIGPRTLPVMALFGVLLVPGFFRLVRTAVMSVRGELYVDAARISGLSDPRIIGRHVLRAVRGPVVIQAALSFGIAVLMQTGLQFLGVVDPTEPSWGQMLADAFSNIYAAPTLVIWPGVTIGVTVAALALCGNGLRDALTEQPRRRR
ncbi:ABC transporter, partial [Streptomyces sp. 150FB]|uniref:ABC transporter permease n=1 Tax=Streptomyces sp. 150FB TaxID=1576605 RepID=UPI0005894EA7